jgi:hypothetical protein
MDTNQSVGLKNDFGQAADMSVPDASFDTPVSTTKLQGGIDIDSDSMLVPMNGSIPVAPETANRINNNEKVRVKGGMDVAQTSPYVDPLLFEEMMKGLMLPQLATGTPYLPQDEVAQLHQGEAVIPAPANPMNPGGNPVAQMLVGAGLNMGANIVDPMKTITGQSVSQQAGIGENSMGKTSSPHQKVNAAEQMSKATGGVPQGGPVGALMGGGAPGASIQGTNQTVQLTPEAQKQTAMADKIRGIDPNMLMSVMQLLGGMTGGKGAMPNG